MVNFLSFLCSELQESSKPIYDLTRKGIQFLWGEEQQLDFEEIKHRLVNCQCYIYQIVREDFTYIQIPVDLLLAVLCIKFNLENPN